MSGHTPNIQTDCMTISWACEFMVQWTLCTKL